MRHTGTSSGADHLQTQLDRSMSYGQSQMKPPGTEVRGEADTALPSNAPNLEAGSFAGWLNGPVTAQSPGRFSLLSMPSPGVAAFTLPRAQHDNTRMPPTLRYPVLRPALPYITHIIPISLACDLLDQYFASTTSAFQHPSSPYVLAYIFRKRSFLPPTNARLCCPALLASMLWIACQTSDAPFLTSSVVARGKVCQKLLELTIHLLKPLVRQPIGSDDTFVPVIDGVALGGFGVNVNLPLPGGRHSGDAAHYAASTSTAEVDDIATYMHLATIISASEYKAASMRWWNVVYSLSRELHFAHELPVSSTDLPDNLPDDGFQYDSETIRPTLTEESREERRRVWWLAYTVDRHLALCYNQPLHLLDSECTTLFRPAPESKWQSIYAYSGPSHQLPHAAAKMKARGATLDVVDHSIFGFFTPFMTLMGECVELQQARNHPRLGVGCRPTSVFESMADHIRMHIEEYAISLTAFRAAHVPEHNLQPESSVADTHNDESNNHSSTLITEHAGQTIVVTAYATYIQHVLLILLAGQWDLLTLLDSPPSSFIATLDFITATGAAISGAESLAPILDYDPDLSFMPLVLRHLSASRLVSAFVVRRSIRKGGRRAIYRGL